MADLSKLNSLRSFVTNYSGKDTILTALEKAALEYGADNIFLLNADYHGRYEDDDCYFAYYNNVTGEIFHDEWSTRYAAPNYNRFCTISIYDAVEAGLANMELLLEVAKKRALKLIENAGTPITPEQAAACHFEVKVSRGRKWKGIGILLGVRRQEYQYAYPMYRTNNSDWGKSITNVAIVADEAAKTINEVNYEYCEFARYDEMTDAWRAAAENFVQNIATAADMSGLNIVFPAELMWNEFIKKFANEAPETAEYTYSAQAARDKKQNDFKAKKIAELTEWAKKSTDVPEAEIPQFVERVFNKRYGR